MMKKSLTCPQCDGKKIWHVPKPAAHGVVHFESFICDGCAYTETYCTNLDGLREARDRYGTSSAFQFIDNEPKATLR